MVSCSSTEDRREIEMEKLLLTGPEEVHSIPPGATQGGRGRVQTDREAGPGAHAFIRVGWVLWGS